MQKTHTTFKTSFKEPVYKTNLKVYIGPDSPIANDRTGRVEQKESKTGKTYFILWLKEWKGEEFDYGLLAHEVTHLVTYVMRNAGVEDDESFAYYVHYWVESILRWIKEEKISSK